MVRKAAIALALVALLLPLSAAAAPTWWSDAPPAQGIPADSVDLPVVYRTFQLDLDGARRALADAPELQSKADGLIFELPSPDGTSVRFRVMEDPILSPELAARRPDVRTYVGVGVDDPYARVRFGVTDQGLHARVSGPNGGYTLGRVPGQPSDLVMAWFEGDKAPVDWACGVDDSFDIEGLADLPVPESTMLLGNQLRTYRWAMNATGEFTQGTPGGVPEVENTMITLTNMLNAVYINEFALRLELVGMNIYTDPATDPFTTGTILNSTMLNQSTSALNSVIGSANYDLGHVVSTGASAGGLAYVGQQCSLSFKGGGGTLINSVFAPSLFPTTVHEVGHQVGATHSFNSIAGSCNGNRTASSAYEIGSGVTIMSYAGLCGSENVAGTSYDIFNAGAHNQIVNKINSTSSCGTTQPTGNTAPSVSANPVLTVPRETAFVLTAGATDNEGDAMTYAWEQYNLGAATPPYDPSQGPTFRNFEPKTSPSRSFPFRLGTSAPWEFLPTVDRTLNFRVVVRDNNPAGGGVTQGSQFVNISGAPARVLSPNGGESLEAGAPTSVTWDPGGSVDADVTILISADAGLTWTELVPSTANDGEATVTLPCDLITQGRIRVQGLENHWYDISNLNFSTTQETTPPVVDCPATFTLVTSNPDGIPNGDPELQPFIDAVTVTDNCSEDLVPTFFFPDVLPIGDSQVAIFVLDDAGNQGLCISTVTVEFDGTSDTPALADGRTGFTSVHPNPFNPRTEIAFRLGRDQNVSLEVFDPRGRRVATLDEGVRPAGDHVIVWQGLDDDGRRMRSGVYALRLRTEDGTDIRRVMLLK